MDGSKVSNDTKANVTTDNGPDDSAIVTRLANEDKVVWYRKPNLRYLYFMLTPTCMGIQMTSGFHSQTVNAMQILPSWIDYFHDPQGSLKGIIAAAYPLGAILSLPFIPIINDKFGRRWFRHQFWHVHCSPSTPRLRHSSVSSFWLSIDRRARLSKGTRSLDLPLSVSYFVGQISAADALRILVKYHGEGEETEFVRAEMAQIQTTLNIEMRTSRSSWLDLARTKGMRKRLLTTCMLGLFTQWSGSTLVSYYLGNLLQIIGQSSSEFKQTINVSISSLNTVTYTYLVELWPYAERSRGIVIFQLFSRCAEFLTTFINPIGMANIGWRYFITFCCFLAFEVIFVYFYFPETVGKTLEEATFLFEEDRPLAEKAALAVEQSIAHELGMTGTHMEDRDTKKSSAV
ncbi:Major facilitator superfamily (MFS) profile domain-containing protein [Madurella fahalii]|uniref:Major facilitator superfamily (MFS) profile domain-containing protein n=1 Tax=Madurella fahalii TaxID=1157608 RepID=A0ABQ0G492_9PEZI